MTIAPPALITGAQRLPLPFGLFSVVTLRPGGTDRWELGVQWELGTCDPVDGIGDVECGDQEIVRITITGSPASGTWKAAYGTPPVETSGLAITATAPQVQEALNVIVPGGVLVGGNAGGPWTIVFNGIGDKPALDLTNTFNTGLIGLVSVQQGNLEPGPNIGLPKDLARNPGGTATATPFTVYGHFTCTPIGYTASAAQDLATAHLMDREQQRVEQAFWTRDLGNVPGLVGMGATDVTIGIASDDLSIALGSLEQFIGTNYGSVGVIHMTRAVALAGLGLDLLTSSSGRLFTVLGTPVVAGAGYPGTGPAGEVPTAGTSWIYATPAVFGYRSEVFDSSARPGDLFDRGQNNLTAVAERTYLLGYDPCGVAAALVFLPGSVDGGAPA